MITSIATVARKSGFIQSILKPNGIRVEKGEVIAYFENDLEIAESSAMEILESVRRLAEAKISPDRLERIRFIFKEQSSSINDTLQYRSAVLKSAKELVSVVGKVGQHEIKLAEAMLEGTFQTMREHELAVQRFDLEIEGAPAILEASKKLIDAKLRLIELQLENCNVKCAEAGILHWYVFEGGYVDIGQPLCLTYRSDDP
jgi:multidrug efflux pump subunit AcrA (membrane-fusion protein)